VTIAGPAPRISGKTGTTAMSDEHVEISWTEVLAALAVMAIAAFLLLS
jgi:hypothetical protein